MDIRAILLIMSSNCIALKTEYLADVVMAVRQHFHSGCVYLLHNQNTEMQLHEMHIEVKNFIERIKLPVASVTLDSLRAFHCQQNRPFYVMFPSGRNVRDTIRKIPARMRLSDGIWLLFLDKSYSLEEFFTGIEIPFDCEFLVAQSEGDHFITLTEVYRISSDRPLETCHFGNWTSRGGLTWPKLDFYERRKSLQGLKLKTGYIEFRSGEGEHLKSVGFFGAMWEILENEVNFKSDYCISVDGSSGARMKNGSWTGVVGMMLRGEVDISNIPFSITPERKSVVDFTFPLLDMRTSIFIRKPDIYSLKWNAFLLPFSARLWITVGLTMFLLSICQETIQVLRRCYAHEESENISLLNSAFFIIGVFLYQALSINPLTLRLLTVTSHLTAMVLLASYSATFVSDLTLPKSSLPFRTFKEFLEDGSYQLGMMRNSAQSSYFNNSKDSLMRQIYRKLVAPQEHSLPEDDVEGVQRLCTIKNTALATNTYNLMNLGYVSNCTITMVPEAFFPGSIGVAVSHNSPYRGLFNHRIQRLRSSGVLQRTYKRFWIDIFQELEDPHISVSVQAVAPILCIVAVNVVIGVVLTVLECWLHCNTKSKQR